MKTVPSAREPEAVYRILGRRLRELREQKDIPQEELATFAGLTRSSIANIESGKQRVFVHQLLQFAARLKVGLNELLPEREFAPESVQAESKQDRTAFLERVKSLAAPEKQKEPPHDKDEPRKES
jgi:transcriptional regulator with XRE-family HTH domain